MTAHCNLVANFAENAGGGLFSEDFGSRIWSSIIYYNKSRQNPVDNMFLVLNYDQYSYCCYTPSTGYWFSVGDDPQLLDEAHVAATSPCRGAGGTLSFGADLDGEVWLNPSTIGCDEFYVTPRVGPLSLIVAAAWPGPEPQVNEQADLTLFARVNGQASRFSWDFGDGMVLTNGGFITMHRWVAPGNYTVVLTAFNDDNPNGVSVSIPVQVKPLMPLSVTNSGFVGTDLKLNFFAQAGVYYSVEQSTNLAPPVTWSTIAHVLGKDLVEYLSFPKSTAPARFYRVRVE